MMQFVKRKLNQRKPFNTDRMEGIVDEWAILIRERERKEGGFRSCFNNDNEKESNEMEKKRETKISSLRNSLFTHQLLTDTIPWLIVFVPLSLALHS